MVTWVRVTGYAVAVLVLAGCGSSPSDGDAAATSTATPTAESGTPSRAPRPEPGQVGSIQGEWENGELLGEPLEIGDRTLPFAEVLYAAQRDGLTYVATGVRDGSRTLRTIQALTPEDEEAADGVDLYGGYVLGDRGPDDRVADGSYLLVGSVPGDVEVVVVGAGGQSRPVTATSTTALPGYTVFYDTGDWEQDWDQVQAAPLTVTTSDGRSVAVRERTWTG